MRIITLILFLAISKTVVAEEGMVSISLARGKAKLPIYVMPNPNAVAILILLPGRDSSTGEIINGKPTSLSFLSRSSSVPTFFRGE